MVPVLIIYYDNLVWNSCIYTVNKNGSHAENKASDGQKECFFSNVLNSVVFYCSWFRKPNFRVDQVTFKHVNGILKCLGGFFWEGGRACAEAKIAYGTSLGSISPLLLAFIVKYYPPILHVVIIKQASKNSVNLGEKSTSDFQSH